MVCVSVCLEQGSSVEDRGGRLARRPMRAGDPLSPPFLITDYLSYHHQPNALLLPIKSAEL